MLTPINTGLQPGVPPTLVAEPFQRLNNIPKAVETAKHGGLDPYLAKARC